MARWQLVVASLLLGQVLKAQDSEPIQIEIAIVESSMAGVAFDDADEEESDGFDVSRLESGEWLDEALRQREVGRDVRVQQLQFTAYESLTTQLRFFFDQSKPGGAGEDGPREQMMLDVKCTPHRRDDGDFDIEYSIVNESRDEAPWEQPLLELSEEPNPGPSIPGHFSDEPETNSNRFTPGEWNLLLMRHRGGEEPAHVIGNLMSFHDTDTVILLRVSEVQETDSTAP